MPSFIIIPENGVQLTIKRSVKGLLKQRIIIVVLTAIFAFVLASIFYKYLPNQNQKTFLISLLAISFIFIVLFLSNWKSKPVNIKREPESISINGETVPLLKTKYILVDEYISAEVLGGNSNIKIVTTDKIFTVAFGVPNNEIDYLVTGIMSFLNIEHVFVKKQFR